MEVKRVAITTWWHYYNYGTILQVVAVQKVLQKLGYKSDIVKYIPSGKQYPTNPKADELHEVSYTNYPRVIDEVRDRKFDLFTVSNLTFSNQTQTNEEFNILNDQYDAFIAGSDQIWTPRVFDERYFLDYVRDNRKKISYAPSFGLSKIENSYVKEKTQELVSQFAHISVREEHGYNILRDDLEIEDVGIMADPTLLLDYEEWRTIIKKPYKNTKKYILCYFLGDNENAWLHAHAISERTKLPIKIIPVLQKDKYKGEFISGVGPEEFFNLIDGAEIVLTDSFHGAIFSIITKTPFYIFERFRSDNGGSQNSRIYNLLNQTNLNSRLITFDERVRTNYTYNVNFAKASSLIGADQEKAGIYLKRSLEIDSPLVSIIVPMYNVRQFIERTLRSIADQTYRNIEIIVVDDGSSDESGEIADKFSKNDKRFKVIHKENNGVSSAKNTGLDNATGEYILIVDGDDAVAPDYVEYLLGLIQNTKSDVAVSLNHYNEQAMDQIDHDRFQVYTSADALEAIYLYRIGVAMWNKIWRRDFIEKNSLRCREDLWFGEGMTFCVQSFTCASRIGVGRRRVYWQEFNTGSATRKFKISSWENGIKALSIQKESWRKIINDDRVKKAWDYHYWWNKCSVARKIWIHGLEDKYKEELKEYVEYIKNNGNVAFKIPISEHQEQLYKKILNNPKEGLLSISIEESTLNEIIDKMPWEITKPDIEDVSEVDRLKLENDTLKSEINSFLSVKRSTRLLIGNIKRKTRVRTRIRKFIKGSK